MSLDLLALERIEVSAMVGRRARRGGMPWHDEPSIVASQPVFFADLLILLFQILAQTAAHLADHGQFVG
jgi:hypothetical protein